MDFAEINIYNLLILCGDYLVYSPCLASEAWVVYIYNRLKWPNFTWDKQEIDKILIDIAYQQGLMNGKMLSLGFEIKEKATREALTTEIIQSSSIEGLQLDAMEVHSSVARHLGIDIGGVLPVDRHVDGIVEMLLDATQKHQADISIERLCQWHSWLFPNSINGLMLINPGALRNDSEGPMQVVSGGYGREKVHFRAPDAKELTHELQKFCQWFNDDQTHVPPIIKAGIAHFWLVTLHPFDDGNGRISRAITDMALAKAEKTSSRFYSMSAQIRKQRKGYYQILEKCQKGSVDISDWLVWFLECLKEAVAQSDDILEHVLNKAKFWQQHATDTFNKRQVSMINLLFDGFNGKLTTSKWAKIIKCSQDTASRDINQLVAINALKKSAEGGRSTNYLLVDFPINQKQ